MESHTKLHQFLLASLFQEFCSCMPIYVAWLGHHYIAGSVNEGENDGVDANANIQDESV